MRLVHVFLYGLLSLSTVIHAEIEISDPDGALAELRRVGGSRGLTFEQAFSCGDQAVFDSDLEFCEVLCNRLYCQKSCRAPDSRVEGRFRFFVEDCSADSVYIYGENNLNVRITKEEYEQGGSTWIIPLLKSLGHFIQPVSHIQLSRVFPGQFFLIENGQRKPLRAYRMFAYILYPGTNQSTPLEIILAPELNGVRQILVLSEGLNSDFLKLRGVVHGR